MVTPMARTPTRAGHTLIELMVVVGIMGAITALGVGLVREQIPRYRLIQASRRLESDVVLLRNTAISLGLETRLVLLSADAAYDDPTQPALASWGLQVGNRALGSTAWDWFPPDAADDGTDDDQSQGRVDIGEGGDEELPGVALGPWGALSGPGTGNPDTVVFSPRGWVMNPSGDFDAEGWIRLTLHNKRALEQGVDDHVELRLARSGYLRRVSSLGQDPGGQAGTGAASTAGGS